MKKFLKILGITFGAIILFLYIAFLVVPPFIKFDNFKAEIQKQFKENSHLNLDYSKIQLYTTPILSFGVVVKDIKVAFDDGTTFFETPKIQGGIALPSLLTLTVKASKCYIEDPYINLEVKNIKQNSKQYKIVEVIQDLINENNAKPKEIKEPNPKLDKLISMIRIKVPSIKISNYNVVVQDRAIGHNLRLEGDELILGYNSARNVFRVKTIAKLLSDEKENILADIKFSSFIPKTQTPQEEADPEEVIKIPYFNLIEIYQKYDLKTNIKTRLKVREDKEENLNIFGYFNISDLNLKLQEIRLPNSYLETRFHGRKMAYESEIFASKTEKISLNGMAKLDKHPKMKLKINSSEIHFKNLLELTCALLDSLNINHTLNQVKASGYLIANADIKTNFKKMKSKGFISVFDGSFVNPIYNIGIKDINLNALFEDNTLNLKNSSMVINGSKLSAKGTIDKHSIADIKADVDNLSLRELYNTFAPKDIKKLYEINSAFLNCHMSIKGKLEKLNIALHTTLRDLSLNDTQKTMFIVNKIADIDLSTNPDTTKGQYKNSGFILNMPKMDTKVNADNITIDINTNDVKINPFDLVYNGLSKINIKGLITNYAKDPNMDLFMEGNISTKNLAQTLGKEISFYTPYRGNLQFKTSVKGDSRKQEILAQLYADKDNYISPVVLDALEGAPSILQAKIDIKGDKIKIKNSGLYRKQSAGFSNNLDENIKNASQIVDLTSIIAGEHINLFRIHILRDLAGRIAIFNKSKFNTKGKITITGNTNDLNYGGGISVDNLDIPELLLNIKKTDISMLSKAFNLALDDINLNNSIIQTSLKGSLVPESVFKIYDLDVKSDFIDVDKAMIVSEKAMKYMPPQSSTSQQSAQTADIPLYALGKFDIKKIKTGDIIVDNAKGDLVIQNNDLTIKDMTADVFRGKVNGNIIVNLITSLITVKINGKNINMDEMMVRAAQMKDTLSGTMNFKTDISLSGATYLEQVKSLKGTLSFSAKNGTYGPFSKLENFFLAQNIRENPIFKNTIGLILTPLLTIDSSHYEELKGNLEFKDGIVKMKPITSKGNVLCLSITGDMDLVKNEIDSKVRVRMASFISSLLGPLAIANPVNLIKNTPGLNIATAKLFSIFSAVVTEEEYNQIPDFNSKYKDKDASKFQIILRGDVAKPLKLVKSFKWLALQKDMDAAKEFSEKFIAEQEELARQAEIKRLQEEYEQAHKIKTGVKNILRMDNTAPEVKKFLEKEKTEELVSNITEEGK